MIRIAVVGDIGSGKSYVARLFGCPVFNADVEVAKLYKNSRRCYNKLKKILPDYITSFPVEKNKLSEAILDQKRSLKKIIKIVHPEIRVKMNKFIKKNRNKKFVVLDIPLLLENKINKKNDVLIFVNAKKKDINKRLKKRHKVSRNILKKLKQFQLPVEIKKKKSDFIIENNFRNTSVKKNVKKVIEKILLNA